MQVEREAAHSDRTIIFSSFDPDVCWCATILELALRICLGLHCSARAKLKPPKHAHTGCTLR